MTASLDEGTERAVVGSFGGRGCGGLRECLERVIEGHCSGLACGPCWFVLGDRILLAGVQGRETGSERVPFVDVAA